MSLGGSHHSLAKAEAPRYDAQRVAIFEGTIGRSKSDRSFNSRSDFPTIAAIHCLF